jgi:hypothetical protein
MPRISVERSEDGRFMARISLRCNDCMQWFEFFGVAEGADPNGARVTSSHTELRIAIGTKETVAEYYAKAVASISDRRKKPLQVEVPVKVIKANFKRAA